MLLTRCCTILPPHHADIEFKPDDYDMVEGITYGADVLLGERGRDYDENLRIMIIWCMSKCLPRFLLDHASSSY